MGISPSQIQTKELQELPKLLGRLDGQRADSAVSRIGNHPLKPFRPGILWGVKGATVHPDR